MFQTLTLRLCSLLADLRTDHDEAGASAVEYALLVVFVAAVIAGSVGILGLEVQGAFPPVSDALP